MEKRECNVLTCDIGASSGRIMHVRLFDGTISIREISRFENAPIVVRESLLWDVLAIYQNVKNGLIEAKHQNIPVDSFGVDTWGNDFALLDAKGQMLGQVHCYRDSRTQGIIEYIESHIPWEELYQKSGMQFARFNTLCQLVAVARDRPRDFDLADSLLFVPDLIAYFLTGRKRNEYTLATISQMFNFHTSGYDADLMNLFSIPPKLMCDVINPGETIGVLTESVAQELGVKPFPVTAVGGHDTASAVAAVTDLDGKVCYISSGTWSILGTELESPLISSKAHRFNFSNEGGVFGTVRFSKNIMGLWIVQQMRAKFKTEGREYSHSDLEQLAASAQPFISFIDPDCEMFFEQGDMPARVRKFCEYTDQRIPRTDAELVRVVMESLAMRYRQVLEQLSDVTGTTFGRVSIVGGGARDRFLCQLTSNILGKPVLAGPYEATALGNALAQLIGIGVIDSLKQGREIIRHSFPPDQYLPDHSPEWESQYQKFLKVTAVEKPKEVSK